jgi:hypothetical protein
MRFQTHLPSIVAYGFLVTERLDAGKSVSAKKTLHSAKCLSFPPITSLAAAQRAQRHVPDSLSRIRYLLSAELIARLAQCPCCGRKNERRLL